MTSRAGLVPERFERELQSELEGDDEDYRSQPKNAKRFVDEVVRTCSRRIGQAPICDAGPVVSACIRVLDLETGGAGAFGETGWQDVRQAADGVWRLDGQICPEATSR